MRHTLSALIQELPHGMPVRQLGPELAGAAAELPPPFGDPTRQTLDALMQVFPQGVPLVQFFCAAIGEPRRARARPISAARRMVTYPLQAQPAPSLQVRLREMQLSPHAFPVVHTRQQSGMGRH